MLVHLSCAVLSVIISAANNQVPTEGSAIICVDTVASQHIGEATYNQSSKEKINNVDKEQDVVEIKTEKSKKVSIHCVGLF